LKFLTNCLYITKTADVFVLRNAVPGFSILVLMETHAPKSHCSSQDTTSALIDLARLLGRQAAKELVDVELADHPTPLNQDEGARDD